MTTQTREVDMKVLYEASNRCIDAFHAAKIDYRDLEWDSLYAGTSLEGVPMLIFVWGVRGADIVHKFEMPEHDESCTISRVAIDDRSGRSFCIIPFTEYVRMHSVADLPPKEEMELPHVALKNGGYSVSMGGEDDVEDVCTDPILNNLEGDDAIEEAEYVDADEPQSEVDQLVDRCHGWLIANQHDGEDRRGTKDRLTFNPDSLHELVEEMIRDCVQ